MEKTEILDYIREELKKIQDKKVTRNVLQDEEYNNALELFADLEQVVSETKKTLSGNALEYLEKQYEKDNKNKTLLFNKVKYSLTPSYTKVSLDTAKLKEDKPKIFEKYKKESVVKASVKLSILKIK